MLECTGSKGTVLVNGMAVKKNTIHTLHSGDEVVFGISGDHAYVSLVFLKKVCYPNQFYSQHLS